VSKRKSKQLRIQEGTDLMTAAEAVGMQTARNFVKHYRFISDMISRLKNNKGISSGQRRYFDSLIEQGVPEPKGDQAQIDRYEGSYAILGEDAHVLKDFVDRLRSGYELSQKQADWADRLCETADSIKNGTAWSPSDEDTEKMKLILELSRCYDSGFWATHGRGRAAVQKVNEFISGSRVYISQDDFDAAQHAVRGKLKMIENPKFSANDRCFVFGRDYAIIIEGPYVIGPKPIVHQYETYSSSYVGYDVLVNGKLEPYCVSRLLKRKTV